ncbi:CpGbinding proteinlike [Caligus rogercresseyi]|uniref:CpGbinding proteinlike n=1 Tax=Caligus rogercresseyi TaxID=217165 RepID=A0A7T8GYZ2_CALRO|nr:CpGbinding proteinlike [Caligus rogercresseyi]
MRLPHSCSPSISNDATELLFFFEPCRTCTQWKQSPPATGRPLKGSTDAGHGPFLQEEPSKAPNRRGQAQKHDHYSRVNDEQRRPGAQRQ